MTGTEVALALIRQEGRCFLQRRPLTASVFPGLWELPGGKLEPGESPRAALERELREELGWRAEQVEALPSLVQAYPECEVVLHPFVCSGSGRLTTELGWGWFLPREMLKLAVPEGTRVVMGRVFSE